LYFLKPYGGGRLQECSELVIFLRCDQCAVDWRRSGGLNATKSVGDDVVLSGDVSYVGVVAHFMLDSGWASEVREFGEKAIDGCASTDGIDAGDQ
jgi:hypothetical protein